eukprot:gene27215-biopygen17752
MRARDAPGLYTMSWSYPDWYLAASPG